MNYVEAAAKISTHVQGYAQKYQLKPLFQRLLQLLVVHKPEQPIPFLIQFLEQYTAHRIIVHGPPGSGRATQAQMLADYYGLTCISMRSILREAINSNSENGLIAEEAMKKGEAVPDEVILALFEERVRQLDTTHNGWVMDGFPRTEQQAEFLDSLGLKPTMFFVLHLSDALAEERVTGRWNDPQTGQSYHMKQNPPPENIRHRLVQRTVDTRDKLLARLADHNASFEKMASRYSQSIKHVINADQGKHKVFQDIQAVLTSIEAPVPTPSSMTPATSAPSTAPSQSAGGGLGGSVSAAATTAVAEEIAEGTAAEGATETPAPEGGSEPAPAAAEGETEAAPATEGEAPPPADAAEGQSEAAE